MEGSVRKRGDKWYYSFEVGKVEGKRKRIERVGGKTKKEAEAALRKALSEYENAGIHFEPSEISVADYMDYWLKNYVDANCRYNTTQNYKGVIENHIKPALGFYKLKSITPLVLQEFMNERSNRGFTKHYLENIMGILSGSFKSAVYPYQFIKENPMLYVKIPKNENIKAETDRRAIPPDEFAKIIERFPEGSNFYIPLQIAYHTGTRVSECCAITWDNIDLDNKTLDINKQVVKKDKKQWYFSTTKTKSSIRQIAIGDTLVNILKKHKKSQMENKLKTGPYYKIYYLEGNTKRIYCMDGTTEYKTIDEKINFVCTNEYGGHVNPETIRYCSRIINYELMIQFNFHALRHTHATKLIEHGANMKDVQERLGHSRLSTTMDTYTHVTEKMKRDTVDIFERAVNSDLPTK